MRLKNILTTAAGILLFCYCSPKKIEQATYELNIIPRPVEMNRTETSFQLKSNPQIYYSQKELALEAHYAKTGLDQVAGIKATLMDDESMEGLKGAIVLSIDDEIDQEEGYRLTIDKNINIAGNSPKGVFYGIQSLLQIIHQSKPYDFVLPGVTINDHPRFSWRGMHLDVSRHFFDKEFIKKYIDILALHKMNTFHWHLVDDQGWRIEIKKYPKLTEIGAWRVDREHLPWNERPTQNPGENASYGGYYTQEDIKEIIAYAAQRHIVVVPEIEMPAHVSSAIAAYPEYSCQGRPITVPPGGVWPITDIYCAGKEETFAFIEDVLSEVIALFPSNFIHIGGDEADKTEWKRCSLCQKRITAENLKDEHELQSYFISRIDKFLSENGRRLIGWDEILEGGLAENAAVMSWRGEQGGIQAAKMNHDVVMTPVSHCYFDYYQSLNKEIEPTAFGGFTDLHKVYHYEPVPKELSEKEARHILGAQGNIWTEYIHTGHHVEYMALPRMSALAEVLWTPDSLKNFNSFLSRLESLFNIFSAMELNYHVAAPQLFEDMIFIDSIAISLKNPLGIGNIHYTLDGSDPTESSLRYTEPIVLRDDAILKAITRLDNGKTSGVKQSRIAKKNPVPAQKTKEKMKHGLLYQYYEGAITKLDDFEKLTFKSSGTIPAVVLPETQTRNMIGLKIEGLVKIPDTGVYTFTRVSDDGSRLYIGNELVVDADGLHGPQPFTGQVALEAGFHQIAIAYFDAGGGKSLELFVKGPYTGDQSIPADWLYSY